MDDTAATELVILYYYHYKKIQTIKTLRHIIYSLNNNKNAHYWEMIYLKKIVSKINK